MPGVFRLAVLALCAGVAMLTGELAATGPWLAALAVLGLVGSLYRQGNRPFVAALTAVEMVCTCVGILATGPAGSPLLPYVVVPTAVAGHSVGRRAVLALTTAGALVLGAGIWALTDRVDDGAAAAASLQWLVLGLGSGLLAAWAERVRTTEGRDDQARYAEAQRLLLQLRALSRQLPGSLDPGSTAQALLDRCAAIAPHERSVVLTRYNGTSLVPVALRGVDRLPWRDPLSEPGTLHDAWQRMELVLDVRPADEDGGGRQGSALLAIPMNASDGSPLALVAFESTRPDAFDGAVEAIERQVRSETPRLETAFLFADLRHTATLEERERLAHEMHNGVAQDLAYLGFALDDLRQQLTATDPERAKRVAELRGELTTLMQDVRLSITDLRSSIGPERGLGTALSSYVRLAGAAGNLTVHLTLTESSFRLPGEQEVALFRVTQEFITLVRRSTGARNVWIVLETDPPTASLELEHDGLAADERTGDTQPELVRIAERVGDIGAVSFVTTPEPDRRRVDVKLPGGQS